jgi:hypothetical protein
MYASQEEIVEFDRSNSEVLVVKIDKLTKSIKDKKIEMTIRENGKNSRGVVIRHWTQVSDSRFCVVVEENCLRLWTWVCHRDKRIFVYFTNLLRVTNNVPEGRESGNSNCTKLEL